MADNDYKKLADWGKYGAPSWKPLEPNYAQLIAEKTAHNVRKGRPPNYCITATEFLEDEEYDRQQMAKRSAFYK